VIKYTVATVVINHWELKPSLAGVDMVRTEAVYKLNPKFCRHYAL
jgi:hypothetical protein